MDDVTMSELFDLDSATTVASNPEVPTVADANDTQGYAELADEMVSLTGAMFGLLLPGHEQDSDPELPAVETQTAALAENGDISSQIESALDQIDVTGSVSLEPIELDHFVPDFEAAPVTPVDSVPMQPTAKSMTLLQEIAFLDD